MLFYRILAASLLAASASNLAAQSNLVDASTLTGKFVLGYQAWHACAGDGKALDGYIHWSHLNRVEPTPSDVVCDLWPDLSEFPTNEQFATGFTLGNGQPAKAYSCYLTNTVLRHFRWMRDYGIDGVVFQRFVKDVFIDSTWAALKNTNLVNVRLGAETYGRVFFLMYDISNDDPAMVMSHLQNDWAYVTGALHLTNSTRYLKHRGKPLLGIWGLGFNGGLAVSTTDAQSRRRFSATAAQKSTSSTARSRMSVCGYSFQQISRSALATMVALRWVCGSSVPPIATSGPTISRTRARRSPSQSS